MPKFTKNGNPMPVPTLTSYKAHAAKAARDLGYGKEVIAKIKKAKTEGEVSLIMATARENWAKSEEKK